MATTIAQVRRMVREHITRIEHEKLDYLYPDWRAIVGQVDIKKRKPDPKNAFRAWLATKDAGFQKRIECADSAFVISRTIQAFHAETGR